MWTTREIDRMNLEMECKMEIKVDAEEVDISRLRLDLHFVHLIVQQQILYSATTKKRFSSPYTTL